MRKPGWGDIYDWQVDRGNGVPIFRQVYREIRSAILSQRLRGGTKLPSTRALAAQLKIARASVVSAYEQLLAEGYLAGKVGSGTYISSDLPEPPERGSPSRPQPRTAKPLRLSRRTKVLEGIVASTSERDRRPFSTGGCSVDSRTADAWRTLSHRAVRSLGPIHLAYSDARGLPELRAEICDYLQAARAVRCTPEQVVVTAGAQHAIDITIRALLDPGDEVWVEDPCYPLTYAALTAADMLPRPIPVDGQGLDVSAGIRSAPKARAVFVTPSNQFPLGVVLSMARRLELLAWARDTGGWIVEDDYDSELRYAGRPLASLQGLDDADRTVYIGTLNKVLFPGLRLGYAVVPRAVLRAFVNTRYLIDRHPPTLEQTVTADFMRDGYFAAHLRRTRLLYRDQRDALVAELTRCLSPDVTLDVPNQGKTLLVYLGNGLSDVDIEQTALAEGIVVRALSPMYRKSPARSALILGFTGYPREVIVPTIARLAAVIAARTAPSKVLRLRKGAR